ncbi:hypothetical protein D3C72_2406770 [compost metagenome]
MFEFVLLMIVRARLLAMQEEVLLMPLLKRKATVKPLLGLRKINLRILIFYFLTNEQL